MPNSLSPTESPTCNGNRLSVMTKEFHRKDGLNARQHSNTLHMKAFLLFLQSLASYTKYLTIFAADAEIIIQAVSNQTALHPTAGPSPIPIAQYFSTQTILDSSQPSHATMFRLSTHHQVGPPLITSGPPVNILFLQKFIQCLLLLISIKIPYLQPRFLPHLPTSIPTSHVPSLSFAPCSQLSIQTLAIVLSCNGREGIDNPRLWYVHY